MELSGHFGFKEPPNLTFLKTLFFQCVQKLADQMLRVPHLFGSGSAAATRTNEGAKSMAYFEHAFLLQLAIDLDDGIRVDDQGFGQASNGWQLITSCQSPRFDGMADLFLKLYVDRNAGGRIGFAKHCATVIAHKYGDGEIWSEYDLWG